MTRNAVAGALGVLLLLAAAGGLLIDAFIDRERERDLREWENRLGLAAEARADAVARLLAGQRRVLEELAGNAALQVYLGQLLAAPAAGGPAEPMERGYLRNLLVATADREGWTDAGGPAVAASLPRPRLAGLALLAPDGRVVVATDGLGALLPVLREAASSPGERPVALLRETPDGAPVLVHAVPVSAVLGADAGGGRRIGVLVGVRRPDQDLHPLLTRGPAFAEDSEALLLEARDGGVLFLSPTRDGSDALHRTTPLVRPGLAEAAGAGSPGGFVALANYRGRPVLQASRPVRGQPWVVAQQVDAGEALALADERRGFLLLTLALVLATVLGLAVAAWRHGSSVRAREQAATARAQAERLQRQTELLHAVTDNISVPTLLLDRARTVRFNNRAFAAAAGTAIATVNGQPLAGVLPPAAAGVLLGLAADAGGDAGRPTLLALDLGTGPRRFQGAAVPVAALGAERDLVLLVLDDVTELEAVRRRHDDLLRDLVTVLVGAIDRHDPAIGEHATRVATVADALAAELGLGDADRENLGLAAALANVGKVALPAALLAKAGPLTDAERTLLRSHVQQSLDLLQGLPFEGPVLETIAQKQECLDGSGYPRGLSGDELTLPGRILAVANAFVALVSPRPWRAALPIRAAIAELAAGADSRYDRRVLAALTHVVENRRDWSSWETPATPQPETR